MANDVAPMQAIADKVRDKIKEQFADLIPDDVYKTMVEAALKEFVSKDLPGLVKEEAKKHLMVLIQEELAKPEWYARWTNNGGMSTMIGNDLIKRIIKENSDDLVAAMFGGLIQQMVVSLRNQPRY